MKEERRTDRVQPGDVQKFRTNFRMLTSLLIILHVECRTYLEHAAAYFFACNTYQVVS